MPSWFDIDAAADLGGLYRRRDELRQASRTPELDVRTDAGSRAAMCAGLERDIARIEGGLDDATLAEARRLT